MFAKTKGKRDFLSVDKEAAREELSLYLERRKLFDMLEGLKVAVYSRIVPLSGSLFVEVHPQFLKTLVFPFPIVKADASFTPKFLSARDNVLEIQPKKDFTSGNIVVYLKDGNSVKLVNLVLKNLNDAPIKGGYFYPQVVVVNRPVLFPSQVLQMYRETYGTVPDVEVVFRIGGIPYLIKPEEKFPNVHFGKKSYLVIPFKGELK